MTSDTDNKGQAHKHYSVDEMMDQLKQQQRDKETQNRLKDGELITRPDGTQVIKVKKRKRRSTQKPKTLNPNLKWSVIGTAAGLGITVIIFTIYIVTKYNGSTFKEETESNITELVAAKSTQLSQLRMTPLFTKASQAEISWGDQSFYHSARFRDIRADIQLTSFFSRYWKGEEILAEQGMVQLQIPQSNGSSGSEATSSDYRFESYRCEALDVLFGNQENACAIKGLHATLSQNPNGRYTMAFANGLIHVPNWPDLEISSGVIRFNESNAEIEARLAAKVSPQGELRLQGIAYKDKNEAVILDVKSVNYPIEELLGEDFGRLIQGNIHSDMGSLCFDASKGDDTALSFIMPFNSNQINILELPMLSDLRNLTGKSQYLHPTFTYCRGTIMRTAKTTTLSNLKLISSKLLSLEGDISIDHEGSLSGKLKIGIPSRLFSATSPAPEIFSPQEDGNIYTQVNLGGTVHNPHDNLNELLKSSQVIIIQNPPVLTAPQESSKFSPDASPENKERAFEELTR